jgi:AICAR transformylase/IMP cyclohydrolase PurH
VFVSIQDSDKDHIAPAAQKMVELGFKLIATGETAAHLEAQGCRSNGSTRWPRAGRITLTGSSTATSSGVA